MEQLISNTNKIFRDKMGEHFTRELIDLWNNNLAYKREGVNYSLNGEPIQIHLDFRIMPGHEQDFGWVMVAIQDITARKKAEDYLRYLGTHDTMTGLYNCAYFDETLRRLEINRRERWSGSSRRVWKNPAFLPGLEAMSLSLLCQMPTQPAHDLMERIRSLVIVNNKFCRDPELSPHLTQF